MKKDSLDLYNDDLRSEELIDSLHHHDQLFNSTAIRFKCFRSILLEHFDNYLTKRSSVHAGITKVISGLRTEKEVLILSRNTDVKIKENLRAEIELIMTVMTNTMLKMNECEDDKKILKNCEFNLVGLVNKLVYHESVRVSILKKAMEINHNYIKLGRAIGATVFDVTGYNIRNIGQKFFIYDDEDLEFVTDMNPIDLREKVIKAHEKEMYTLCDLLELESIEELKENWNRLDCMLANYNLFKNARNTFVETHEGLVRTLVFKVMKRPQYSHRKDLGEVLVHRCLNKLTSNIFTYLPKCGYSTFAYPHIKQEIKSELASLEIVQLPAKYLLMQQEVIEAGKSEGKEWSIDLALRKLKPKYPSEHLTSELLLNIRNGTSKTLNLYTTFDSDDEEREIDLSRAAVAQSDIASSEIGSVILEKLKELTEDDRQKIQHYFELVGDGNLQYLEYIRSLKNEDTYRVIKSIERLRSEYEKETVAFNNKLG